MDKKTLIPCRVIKAFSLYNRGEIAGFTQSFIEKVNAKGKVLEPIEGGKPVELSGTVQHLDESAGGAAESPKRKGKKAK